MNTLVTAWLWTLLAAATGFAASFVSRSLLQLSRPWFVAVYAILVLGCFGFYARTTRLSVLAQFRRRWLAGAIGGVVAGAYLIRNAGGPPPTGAGRMVDLLWLGVANGALDALLLTVLPVLALYGSRSTHALASHRSRLAWAAVALIGATIVTAAFHVGFPAYRGARLLQPIGANLLITLAYLLTGSPVAALVAHILLQVAAVVHGVGPVI